MQSTLVCLLRASHGRKPASASWAWLRERPPGGRDLLVRLFTGRQPIRPFPGVRSANCLQECRQQCDPHAHFGPKGRRCRLPHPAAQPGSKTSRCAALTWQPLRRGRQGRRGGGWISAAQLGLAGTSGTAGRESFQAPHPDGSAIREAGAAALSESIKQKE